MKKKLRSGIIILLGMSLIIPFSLSAAEVVNDSVRQWAKEAVSQEKTMSAAPSGNTVAVLNFKNSSGDAALNPLQKGFAFMLMTDLANVPGIQLVERNRLQALMDELKMGASGIVANDTAPRIGKLVRAAYLVGGELNSLNENELHVGSYLWGVSSDKLLGQPSATGSIESIFDLEKKILFAIIDELKIKLNAEQKKQLSKPLTTNVRALYYLSRGLDSSDRGNYQQAQVFYGKALDADPQIGAASSASKELTDKKLAPAKPKEAAVTTRNLVQNSSTDSLKQNNSTFRALNPYQIEQGRGSGQVKVSW
jgi:TolB-like protein